MMTKMLSKKFATATKYILQVGLSNFGEYDQAGRQETNVKFPFKLRFEPSSEVHNMFPTAITSAGTMGFVK